MSIYNLYNNLVDSGKYSMVPSSNYQQNLENNIKQNYSGADYFRNSTSEMAKDYINRAETPTGKALMNYVMAAGAVPVGAASFPYDAYQALNRYDKAPAPEIGLDSIVPENMYRGKTNFIDTYKKEQPITAAYNRAMGMVDPLAESLGQELSNFNLKNTLSNMFSTKANASEKLGMSRNYPTNPDLEEEYANLNLEIDPYSRTDGILSALKNFGGNVGGYLKDGAGRMITSQALSGAGGMIFGPMGALVGGLAGLFKGGDMFKQSYDPFYKQFADPSQGGAGFKDRYGINTVSAFGDYGKYALNKAYGINALEGDKGDFYRDVTNKKNAAMTDANVGFGDSGDASDGGANAGTSNAGSGSSDDGFI